MTTNSFSVGQVLTAAQMNNVANSGLVYVTSASLVNATGASPVNVTSCFSSTYTNYRIVVSNLVISAAAFVQFQMLSGTTPANAANTYKTQRFTANGTTLTGAAFSDTKGNLPAGGVSANAFSGDIFCPQLAKYTHTVCSGNYDGNSTAPIIDTDYCIHSVATAYDGIRLFPENGTITSGTVTIFGYRQA